MRKNYKSFFFTKWKLEQGKIKDSGRSRHEYLSKSSIKLTTWKDLGSTQVNGTVFIRKLCSMEAVCTFAFKFDLVWIPSHYFVMPVEDLTSVNLWTFWPMIPLHFIHYKNDFWSLVTCPFKFLPQSQCHIKGKEHEEMSNLEMNKDVPPNILESFWQYIQIYHSLLYMSLLCSCLFQKCKDFKKMHIVGNRTIQSS